MRCKFFSTVMALLLILPFAPPKALEAQGRVSGLKISNASVVGTTLSFDVTMSTDSSAGSPHLGFLGDHYHSFSTTTWTSTTTSTWSSPSTNTYPCNTTTTTTHITCTGPPPTSSFYPCSTQTFTNYSICSSTSPNPYTSTYTYYHTTSYLYGRTILNPPLPAIDWGDGNALSMTTLPLISSGPTRVYRRSFSHSYGSTGAYQVHVGAYSQRINSTLPGGGNILTANAPDSFKYHSYSSTVHRTGGATTNSTYQDSTRTIASPSHVPVGVTTSTSLGVPVELQTFTVAEASGSMGPSHHGSPMEAAGLGLALAALALGFVLSRKD